MKNTALVFSLRSPMNSSEVPKDRSGVVSVFDLLFGGDLQNTEKMKERVLKNKEREREKKDED